MTTGFATDGAWLHAPLTPAFVGLASGEPVVLAGRFDAGMLGTFVDGLLRRAVEGWFDNGGGSCVVVPLEFDVRADGRHEADLEAALARLDDAAGELGARVDAVCFPDLPLLARDRSGEPDLPVWCRHQLSLVVYGERTRRFAVLDTPPGLSPQQVREYRLECGIASYWAALYYPWVLTASGSELVFTPPCGHVLGAWHRSSMQRGVHRPPVNLSLAGAFDVETVLPPATLDLLVPAEINPLCAFPGAGIRPWSARTLAVDPAWRAVQVARLVPLLARHWSDLRGPGVPEAVVRSLRDQGDSPALWCVGEPTWERAQATGPEENGYGRLDVVLRTAADDRIGLRVSISPDGADWFTYLPEQS